MFSFFKKKETNPPEEPEDGFEIVENNKGDDENESKAPLYPSDISSILKNPIYPPVPPVLPVLLATGPQTHTIHPLQDVPFRLSKKFQRDDYNIILLKAKEILTVINRCLNDENWNYDFNVEKSVINQ